MNTELHGIRRKIRAGSVSDGKHRNTLATELHRNEEKHRNTLATDEHGIRTEKKTLSVIFANAEIHIYSKARMDPRIREGDQGAEKKGESEPEALAMVGKKMHLPRNYTE